MLKEIDQYFPKFILPNVNGVMYKKVVCDQILWETVSSEIKQFLYSNGFQSF